MMVLEDILKQMDFNRLQEDLKLVSQHRKLRKQGRVAIHQADSRSFKRNRIELLVFNDLVVYGKWARHLISSEKKLIVYRHTHISLVSASPSKLQDCSFNFAIVGDNPVEFVCECASAAEKQRWLDAFEPILDEEEDICELF